MDGKTISKDLKLEDQAITIGNERAAMLPDVAFPKEFSDISREHCKIIYKSFNDIRKGLFIFYNFNKKDTMHWISQEVQLV